MIGHIISKDGIKVDHSRVEGIQKIDIPRKKKEVQSFIGRVNFLIRFIANFTEIMKHITNMLRKDNEIKWNKESKNSLLKIKKALTEAPILISPNCTKYFHIFSFASKHIVARVLLRKNTESLEKPITFYRKILRDATLKYDIMDK